MKKARYAILSIWVGGLFCMAFTQQNILIPAIWTGIAAVLFGITLLADKLK